jgi:hypothetical protein
MLSALRDFFNRRRRHDLAISKIRRRPFEFCERADEYKSRRSNDHGDGVWPRLISQRDLILLASRHRYGATMEVLLSDRTLEFLVSTQNLEPETLFGRVLNDDTLLDCRC